MHFLRKVDSNSKGGGTVTAAAEEEVEEEVLILSLPSEVEGTTSLDDDGESLRFSSLSANACELMPILEIANCCAGVVFGRKREGEDSTVG